MNAREVRSLALLCCLFAGGCGRRTESHARARAVADIEVAPRIDDDAHDGPDDPQAREALNDEAFDRAATVSVVRAEYTITLPDESGAVSAERELRIDDEGTRASLTFTGNGLPIQRDVRIGARAGFGDGMVISSDGRQYRFIPPDQLQRLLFGPRPRTNSFVTFLRSDQSVTAARGGLALVITGDRTGPRHEIACRILVALFLGGDPASARVGCANATVPTRIVLEARGWQAMVLSRVQLSDANVPGGSLAVPPRGASPDLALTDPAAFGSFFDDAAVQAMPGVHSPRAVLTAVNALQRPALVFMDESAIGWVASGATGTFGNLVSGHHAFRARSLDGLERSRASSEPLPAEIRFELDPALAQ